MKMLRFYCLNWQVQVHNKIYTNRYLTETVYCVLILQYELNKKMTRPFIPPLTARPHADARTTDGIIVLQYLFLLF